jgi:protein-disulfide isomerase
MLQRNFALAQALQINGTPAFVIGDEVVRGAIDMRALRQIVGQTRANSS